MERPHLYSHMYLWARSSEGLFVVVPLLFLLIIIWRSDVICFFVRVRLCDSPSEGGTCVR